MVPTKHMTPHVPITVNEILEDVHAALEIGITLVHLHARDENTGQPTYKAEIYQRLIEKIRKFSNDVVICVSLSGRSFQEFEKRSQPLCLTGQAKPDMGSLTLSSLNFSSGENINSPIMIERLALEMKERSIRPELEVFDIGMINYAKYLERKGVLEPPHYFNLIVGNIASAQADMLQIGIMLKELPPNSLWSLGGIGDKQLAANSMGIIFGGGVRVGIEDNIWMDSQKRVHAKNIDLLKRVKLIAEIYERPIMTPAEFRRLFELESKSDGILSHGPKYHTAGNVNSSPFGGERISDQLCL